MVLVVRMKKVYERTKRGEQQNLDEYEKNKSKSFTVGMI